MPNNATTPTPNLSPIPTIVLPAGLALGLLGDALIGEVIFPGPGLTLWMTLFGITASWLAAKKQSPHLNSIIAWSLVAVAASLMLVFRTVPFVIMAMFAVMLTAAAMVMMTLKGVSLRHSLLADHLSAALNVPLQALKGAFPVISGIDFRESSRNPRCLAVLRGLLIALPLLLVFGSLFSQADLKFEALATNVLSIFSPEFPEHLIIFFLYFWLATGILATLYRPPALEISQPTRRFALGFEETLIIMGTLVVLFLTFVVMQLPYLFGGRTTIEATEGLILADYARRGFFELVVVSGLSLGVLLVMAKVSLAPRTFRALAAVMLVSVLLILASAIQRLYLYTESFGLTIDRITAFTFILWIAVCLVLFAMILLRGRTGGFAMGMTCSAIVIAFLFALINPASLVIQVNAGAALAGKREPDIAYLISLRSEGIPALAAQFDALDSATRCSLAFSWLQSLQQQETGYGDFQWLNDWRTWNLIHSRAWHTLNGIEEKLTTYFTMECISYRSGLQLPALGPMPE